MKESLEVTRAYMALGEALRNLLEAPNRIFLSEMRAYMALGGALRNMWEAHDRALYERDEALAALAQLQETDRARRAIDDMNRDQHFADLRKGIPLRVEPSEQEDFQRGDLVRVKNRHPEWGVVSNRGESSPITSKKVFWTCELAWAAGLKRYKEFTQRTWNANLLKRVTQCVSVESTRSAGA